MKNADKKKSHTHTHNNQTVHTRRLGGDHRGQRTQRDAIRQCEDKGNDANAEHAGHDEMPSRVADTQLQRQSGGGGRHNGTTTTAAAAATTTQQSNSAPQEREEDDGGSTDNG